MTTCWLARSLILLWISCFYHEHDVIFIPDVREYMGRNPRSVTAMRNEKAKLAAEPNLSQILWRTRKERNVFASKSGKEAMRVIYPSRDREFNTTNNGGARPQSVEVPCGNGMMRSCKSLTELRATRRKNLHEANSSNAILNFERPARCPKLGSLTKHGEYGFLSRQLDKGMADKLYDHRPRAMFDQSSKKLRLL